MKKYKINEFAKLNKTTIRTLQYYDDIQILKPSIKDSKGYRYYIDRQIDNFQLIHLLIQSGLSIAQILKDLKVYNWSYKSLYTKHQKHLNDYFSEKLKNLELINSNFNNIDKNILKDFEKTNITLNEFYFYKSIKLDEYDLLENLNSLKNYFNNYSNSPTLLIEFNLFEKQTIKIGVMKEGRLQIKNKYLNLIEATSIENLKGTHRKISTGTYSQIFKKYNGLIDSIINQNSDFNRIFILIHQTNNINQKNLYETIIH